MPDKDCLLQGEVLYGRKEKLLEEKNVGVLDRHFNAATLSGAFSGIKQANYIKLLKHNYESINKSSFAFNQKHSRSILSILRPEFIHENEHRENGKEKNCNGATVFDIGSKRKISIQVSHTEIVRW